MTTAYVQPAADFAGLFIGIGGMVLLLTFSYMVYQWIRLLKPIVDTEEKIELLKEIAVTKLAKRKGIDLNEELAKKNMFNKRSYKKVVEEKILRELFSEKELKELD